MATPRNDPKQAAKRTSSTDSDRRLVDAIAKSEGTGEPVVAPLRTDDRVLARVSDGIYRQPGSALRELIANAYDADARRVIVHTDAPRFDRISIMDDGMGMSKESLVRLINHIGGSAKQTSVGAEIGVTSADDPMKSPQGRLLIGKIGIGLFSVAQLTRHFRIITRRKGDPYRLVADVRLHTFSDDETALSAEGMTTMGQVEIHSVAAKRRDSHGTEIILMTIQPPAQEYLRSKQLWARREDVENSKFVAPAYHAGRVKEGTDEYDIHPVFPWAVSSDIEPLEKFRMLYESVVKLKGKRAANIKLSDVLDNYLQMVWLLSLAMPLRYLDDIHPFDLTGEMLDDVYVLPNRERVGAEHLNIGKKESLRSKLDLCAKSPENFRVFLDDIELRRPMRYDFKSMDALKRRAVMFVGKWSLDLRDRELAVTGGKELAVESYFVWMPKVYPVEHNGVITRIADASGMLFDPHFFANQIAEETRKRQITGEIFALRGLGASLNIDRESFNFGHPHAKAVANWTHLLLRHIMNTLKRIGKEGRSKRQEASQKIIKQRVREIVEDIFEDEPQWAEIISDEHLEDAREEGRLALSSKEIFHDVALSDSISFKMEAVATVLNGYGLLDDVDYDTTQEILRAILKIFQAE